MALPFVIHGGIFMLTWSLAMIVKNEEEVLARCLDSIKEIVDEIIIIDTGSTDKTVEIAKKYTDKIYHFEWINDFSKARNYSFSKATCDYIMWLDADDFFDEEAQTELLRLKKSLSPEIDVIYLKYNIGFDANANVTTTSRRERIVKRAKNFQWNEPVHECLTVSGSTLTSDIAVTHGDKIRTQTHRNLNIYELQEELTDRGRFYYARELKTHAQYDKAIKNYEQFLNDGRGWLEDNLRACIDLAECYYAINEKKAATKCLFQTFLYDKPRSETCCRIGSHFFSEQNYHLATYWYDLALHPNSQYEGGFFNKDYTDFIPYIQLCMIFFKMGEHDLSYKYHLKSQAIKPNDASVLYNVEYFEKFFKDQPQK